MRIADWIAIGGVIFGAIGVLIQTNVRIARLEEDVKHLERLIYKNGDKNGDRH